MRQEGERPNLRPRHAIADEQIHAPNEFFRLSSFDDGLKAWTELLREAALNGGHDPA